MNPELTIEELKALEQRADDEARRTDIGTVEAGWLQKLAEAARETAQFRKQRQEGAAGGCTCDEQKQKPPEPAPDAAKV